MAKTLISNVRPLYWSCLFLLVAGLAWAGSSSAPDTSVDWDPEATQELQKALHEMHHIWNTGDITGLKKQIIGDDVLVTFELDPVTHKPIRLGSKKDLWSFVDDIVDDIEQESAISFLGKPVLNCRATDSFGVCTEECSVKVSMPSGVEEHHHLWSTATAVKLADGWKFIQWHMSIGSPAEVYKDGELVGYK
ncbi:MAG TPA: hypothetical protein VLV83_20905 [Acidobacteriota bacterium]|nr:hypothetical protein [Acidobacteriota bacterium]